MVISETECEKHCQLSQLAGSDPWRLCSVRELVPLTILIRLFQVKETFFT